MDANAGDVVRRDYGPDPGQFGELRLGRAARRNGVVVIVHGGFWRPHRELDMTAPIAADLAERGWDTWNLEYRRPGPGGWRETLHDCAAGIDHLLALREEFPLNLGNVLVLGHSAGGQLAVWCAGRAATAQRDATARPAVRPVLAVSLAGVLDLDHAARTHVGHDAVAEFLGAGPDEQPLPYRSADPVARVPVGVPVRCVHSRTDERVPFELSTRYVAAARRAGDDATITEIPGGHTDVIDIRHPAWHTVAAMLDTG